jgi:hypothetical protein
MTGMRRLLPACLRWFLLMTILAACVFPAGISLNRAAIQFTVLPHPDGALYVGDQVSFEVLAPPQFDSTGQRVAVSFNGQELGRASFAPYGVGERREAVLWWVWDTRQLRPGSYTLAFATYPGGIKWTDSVSLEPASQVPLPEPGAHWASTTTACCSMYYITGTDAARDIVSLGQIADAQSADVSARLGTSLKEKIPLVFLPRELGNGGFTLNAVYVSYLDRNYGDTDLGLLLHHELVHFYDQSLGGNYKPVFFEEGLAVYLSGGHFRPEPIGPQAAAVLDLGWYIPLRTLVEDFYPQQHEIGYAEAAGLVQYLGTTYGWEAFDRFYRSIQPPGGKSTSAVIDAALRSNLGISFSEMEAGYKDYLRLQTVTEADRQELQLTVRFFAALRRYQQALDPSAYFMTAWLPDGAEMRKRGIVADLLRAPQGIANRWIESLLMQAWKELSNREYAAADRTLTGINRMLSVIPPEKQALPQE